MRRPDTQSKGSSWPKCIRDVVKHVSSGVRPESQSPPGTRVARKFFDDYPRFFETSATSANHSRLNLRYEAIFGENEEIFRGARVLDIASHDGRWSLAALKTGAQSVTGIEAKPHLVENAEVNLAAYGVDKSRYRFCSGDVFEVLARETFEVDVVLCLGFLYHTLRFNELMMRIRQLNPQYLIIDTEVLSGHRDKALILIHQEIVSREGNAVADEFSHGDWVLSGKPNVRGLRKVMQAYEFQLEKFSDWDGLIRDNPTATHVKDYRAHERVTALFRTCQNVIRS